MNEITTDVKNCMRECLMNLFWAKKDFIQFFEDNGIKHENLKLLYDQKGAKRHEIVEETFSFLTRLGTKGELGFRSILESLLNWDYFDPYYFDNLKKLDKTSAKKTLTQLKQLNDRKKSESLKTKQENEQEFLKKQTPILNLEKLRESFYLLLKNETSKQQRGYILEEIILDLARHSKLEITESFKVNGEQIDGAIKYDGEHYLFEAKWQDALSANESVYQFVGKVEGKLYGRGLFISINGFSQNVLESLTKGKALKTIFVDGADLMHVIDGRLTFIEMIDRKIKAAQTKGLIYIDPMTDNPKIQ